MHENPIRASVFWDGATAPSGTNNHTALKVVWARRLSHLNVYGPAFFFVFFIMAALFVCVQVSMSDARWLDCLRHYWFKYVVWKDVSISQLFLSVWVVSVLHKSLYSYTTAAPVCHLLTQTTCYQLAHLSGAELPFMIRVTPVLFLLSQVKMSAKKDFSRAGK